MAPTDAARPAPAATGYRPRYDRHGGAIEQHRTPCGWREQQAIYLDPRGVAVALGGEASGRTVAAPGPGHSRADRSLSIRLDPHAPDGFICHSFASDDWRDCREHVRRALGLPAHRWCPMAYRQPRNVAADDGGRDTVGDAAGTWRAARDPRGTLAERYLIITRGLALSDDIAGDVIRFHPRLWYRERAAYTAGMIGLLRDVLRNEPRGIHRTFLDRDGHKLGRKMLGRAKGGAIKLDDDASLTWVVCW